MHQSESSPAGLWSTRNAIRRLYEETSMKRLVWRLLWIDFYEETSMKTFSRKVLLFKIHCTRRLKIIFFRQLSRSLRLSIWELPAIEWEHLKEFLSRTPLRNSDSELQRVSRKGKIPIVRSQTSSPIDAGDLVSPHVKRKSSASEKTNFS